jgi:hypothetical protein
MVVEFLFANRYSTKLTHNLFLSYNVGSHFTLRKTCENSVLKSAREKETSCKIWCRWDGSIKDDL